MIVVVRRLALLMTILAASCVGAVAQQSPQELRDAERKAAFEAADKAAVRGKSDVTLLDQGVLKLPVGYAYVPQPQAGRLMRAMGNSNAPTLIGIVFPTGQGEWFATIRFIKEGYIKDDDAKNWNADELLQNLKDGAAEGNEDRQARGFAPLEVTRWLEKPTYEAADHRLVWSALVRQIGNKDEDGSANYNTYALGREGYFSLNLVTSTNSVATDKQYAHSLLAALNFVPGKIYADFNAATDTVAAYGLAALIGGAAAKKLGLFAALGVFLLKFWKIGALAVVGFGALFAKFFSRKTR